MKVKIVDQGKCFGNDHWYMFYCGKCERTIDINLRKKNRLKCEYCNETIDYKQDK